MQGEVFESSELEDEKKLKKKNVSIQKKKKDRKHEVKENLKEHRNGGEVSNEGGSCMGGGWG